MENTDEIVEKLKEFGYFKFLSADEIILAEAKIVKSLKSDKLPCDFDRFDTQEHKLISLDRRYYAADNEDLAEGDIGELIENMKPVLEKEGVKVGEVGNNIDYGDAGKYDIVVSGKTFKIYSSEECENSEIWVLATKRALELLNTLLSEANSEERVYGLYGGNDGKIMILNPSLLEYLSELNIKPVNELYTAESIKLG